MGNSNPDFMQGMNITTEFIDLEIDAKTSTEAIEALAKHLVENGAVKPSYVPAILKREIDYCTGLAFDEMGIALPHTDAEHVNEASIAIGILKNPVTFQSMGMPDIPVEVEMLVMLAIKEPHTQLDFLSTLMTTFQKPGRLRSMKACTDRQQLLELFVSFFVPQDE